MGSRPARAAFNVGDPAQLGVGRANYRTADVELLNALADALTPGNPYDVSSP
ncbi:hypothetical protein [Nonomuraea cavernae]|uniref:Uncharacterized protein n=1 Tax=Nonomuraea cavernae TaxID=2045107 RepID=A0A917YY92_9ACTN|nr:hypothetical protein [Nonomuraea cavernae]MCA2187508.1 hypothetical protein [Nonomuraea cavernae]GGO68835.1 hypothetical protein GCM10012289_28540 [Nonomuraea cavernae]